MSQGLGAAGLSATGLVPPAVCVPLCVAVSDGRRARLAVCRSLVAPPRIPRPAVRGGVGWPTAGWREGLADTRSRQRRPRQSDTPRRAAKNYNRFRAGLPSLGRPGAVGRDSAGMTMGAVLWWWCVCGVCGGGGRGVTILFSDIVGFTNMASSSKTADLVPHTPPYTPTVTDAKWT